MANPTGSGWTKLAAAGALTMLTACTSIGSGDGARGENAIGAAHLTDIRATASLPRLAADADLERAARQQAGFMAQTGAMKHTTGFGRSFERRMRGNGIDGAAAENIAHGAFGTDELFQRWMDSPPHRRNMLNAGFTRFGLASAKEPGGSRRYWALVLAK